jgi:hypothetical protein
VETLSRSAGDSRSALVPNRVKRAPISELLSRGVPVVLLERELAQCEVVCANCHRRRTARCGNWARVTENQSRKGAARPRIGRNLSWVYEQLKASACIDCGLRDPLVLEHDHVGKKRAGVMSLAWNEYSLETLAAEVAACEVAACEVRCCNCHRRRASDLRGWFRSSADTLAMGL